MEVVVENDNSIVDDDGDVDVGDAESEETIQIEPILICSVISELYACSRALSTSININTRANNKRITTTTQTTTPTITTRPRTHAE